MKYALTFLLSCCLSTCLFTQSNPIEASASWQHFTISNDNDGAISYEFVVYEKQREIARRTLKAGQGFKPGNEENWSRGAVRRLNVTAEYTDEIRRNDLAAVDAQRVAKQRKLDAWYNQQVRNFDGDASTRILIALAANTKTDPNASWWERAFTDVTRWTGKTIQFTLDAAELLAFIEDARYKSWRELIADVGRNQLEDAAWERFGEILGRKINLSEELTTDLLKVGARYVSYQVQFAETYENSEQQYDREANEVKAAINRRWESKVIHRKSLAGLPYKSKPFGFKVEFSGQPLNFGGPLNDYWKGNPERVLVDKQDGSDESEIADGLWNGSYHVGGRMTILPAMKFIGPYNQLFADVGYGGNYYDLNTEDGYSADPMLFRNVGQGAFSTRFPVSLNLRQFNYGLLYRIGVTRSVVLDLKAGYQQQNAILDFRYAELNEGFSWRNETLDIAESERVPYFGANLSIGRRIKKGPKLFVSYHTFKSGLKLPDDNAQFTFTSGSNAGAGAAYDSADKFVYRVLVGLKLSL